jgi:hypothetical protein
VSVVAVLGAIVLGVLVGGCGGADSPSSTASPVVSSTTTIRATVTSRRPPPRPPASESGTTVVDGASTTASGNTGTTTPVATTTHGATATTSRATATTARATSTTEATATTVKADVVLRVTGPSGAKELSMADLKAMPSVEGWGGWKNQLGNITAPTLWRGVSVRALMDLVGGGGSIVVVASDGYEQAFSSGEVDGAIAMYDPATGDTITSISGGLSTIVAYSEGGKAIGSSQGPIRIAFVSPEKDQVTDGTNWVKWVVKINVN